MKKLFNIILTISLLSILFVLFVACDTIEKDSVYTQGIVNENQWQDAFSASLSATRYQIYENFNTTNCSNPILSYNVNYVYDSSKFYSYSSQIARYNINSDIIYQNSQSYSFVEGLDCKKYTSSISPDSDSVTWTPSTRHCISEEVAQGMFVSESNYLATLVCPFGIGNLSGKFASFKFDKKSNSYTAEFDLESCTTNYSITFENGKIRTINYKQNVPTNDSSVYGGLYEYNIIISYE